MTSQAPVTYHDMPIGRVFRPHTFDLDPGSLERYARQFATGDGAPPTGLLMVHARKSYLTEGPIPSGGVMAEVSVRYHRAVLPGRGYRFQTTVTERFERKGKGWVRLEAALTRDGDHLATVVILGVWPL